MTEERREYLAELAEEYDVPWHVVLVLADMLGPSEDHDGLICELEDYEAFGFDF